MVQHTYPGEIETNPTAMAITRYWNNGNAPQQPRSLQRKLNPAFGKACHYCKKEKSLPIVLQWFK